MIGFDKQNDTLSTVQRGVFNEYADTSNGVSLYLPPPIELYTMLSLKAHFIIFCVFLILHSAILFIVDNFWLKCLPQNTTTLEKLLHSHLKSHFPFPYSDWDSEKGSCKDHIMRHKTAQREVTITTFVNLFFALLMTFPITILCKFLFLYFIIFFIA